MDNIYIKAVEKNRELILAAEEYIWKNPETGFREYKTSQYLRECFEGLGYDVVTAEDIPGFYTLLDTGREGPEILILAELDALICPDHPDADIDTGAVHCCGHNAQCAALLGVAAALKEPHILDGLCGRVRLCAVPAEELIELEYRCELIRQGRIKYLGGKPEFLHRGYFDGVDIAFMVHASSGEVMSASAGAVGCVVKRVIYKGVASHAGGAPWCGCNALYAATQGLTAINAIRETFREPDIIRVHPIITKGGGAVNAIPDRVVLESYVRGRSFDAISDANKRVNRALCGAALSIGASIEIIDTPGYAPLITDKGMAALAAEAAKALYDIPYYYSEDIGSGSTDMGDLSAVMPIIHTYMPGAEGTFHGADFKISNPMLACVGSAKWQISMLALLLENGAERAKHIISDFKPTFASKEEYFSFIERFNCSGDRIVYSDCEAVVKL